MIKEGIYYGGMFICVGSTSLLLINYLYPNTTKNLFYNSVKAFHYIKREFKKKFNNYNYENIPMTQIIKSTPKKYNKYLGYKVSDDTTHECDAPDDYFKNEKFDLMIVIHKNEFENQEYYRILSEKDKLKKCKFDKSTPLFLQVEIEQFGKRTSIHEYLKSFYLDGNKILSKTFLEWYLKKFS